MRCVSASLFWLSLLYDWLPNVNLCDNGACCCFAGSASANFGNDSIEKMPLEVYLGRAMVVDLSQTFSQSRVKHLITLEDIRPHAEEIGATSRLLVKTDRWSDSTVFPEKIPVIAADLPAWLQKNGVRLLGVDLPSMDEIDSKSLQNHHALARAGIAIVESLDLSDVASGIYNFAALPLKIAGADGAPVRAILWRE